MESKVVIICTGATAKTLKIPREAELMGRGISTCATCDGFFYRQKDVIVVGGGDSAMEEALYLANLCKSVLVVHRSAQFRASKIMLERAQKHANIRFQLWSTVVEPIADKSGLTGVVLEDTRNGQRQNLTVDGLFYGIGHTPNTGIFAPFLECDSHGYLKVHDFTLTKVPGVFAAGDVADPVFKQAITAAGMGCQAAMQAAKYIEAASWNS